MKTSMSFQECTAEVERQAKAKIDFVMPGSAIEYVGGTTPSLRFQGLEFAIGDTAHDQLREFLGMPERFLQHIRKNAPDLEEINFNRLLAESKKDRLLRTLDGQVRAFLSSRFLCADNEPLLKTIGPWLDDHGFHVASSHVDANRIFIKALSPRLMGEVSKGDVIQAGLSFTNSEIGLGRILVEPFAMRLVCTNGMISLDTVMDAFTRRHIGALLEAGEDGVVTPVSLDAVWAKLRAYLDQALSEKSFEDTLGALRVSHDRQIPLKLTTEDLLKRLARTFAVPKGEAEQIGRWFEEEDERTAFGLIQGITRAAQDIPSYERATELERLGGRVAGLTAREWEDLIAA